MEVTTTKLYDDFRCQHEGGISCETMEQIPDDQRVVIDRCGCVFRKSHLESDIRRQMLDNVLQWFQRGGEVSPLSCPNRDGIIGETYTPRNVILDLGRYMEMWEKAKQSPKADFAGLINCEFNTRQLALIPPELAQVLKDISLEQQGDDWYGMNWSQFSTKCRKLHEKYQHNQLSSENVQRKLDYDALRNLTLQKWETVKNKALEGIRQPAFDEQSWGSFKKMVFTARFIYNGALAILSYYGLWVLKLGNFVSEDTYEEAIEGNVKDRMAILLLERDGIGYDLQERPLKTFEYHLWNYLNGH